MHYFLVGLALLLFLIYAARAFIKTDPKKLTQTLRKIGGWAAIGLAALLAIRGLFPIALPLAAIGAMLLGRSFPFADAIPGGFGSFSGRADRKQAQRSKVRTTYIEMTLDHDSGEMDGEIIKGKHAGARVSDLGRDNLITLLVGYRSADPQSAQLLEAYLDRTDSQWRASAGAGSGGLGEAAHGVMELAEAYEVLGLEPGASNKKISRAHRNLMKKLHPDQGGSTYLAAKINQAKDVLLDNI